VSALKVDVLMGTSLDDIEGQCRARTATGVDGLFTFEGQHDPFLPLAIAARTVDADLMTNVAIAFPRSPMQLANVAYDLQVLSRGRFRLGLGSQVKPAIEKRFGAQWSRPVPRMREWVQATKAIFAAWEGTAKLDFRGEFTTHTLMTPNFNPGPNPYGPPPVLVGALGPRMTEIAAEVADGVLVMPFNSARHLAERTLPAIERGRVKGGRGTDDVEVICEAIVCAGRNEEEITVATRGVKGLLSFYGSTPSYKPVLDVEGWGELQPELNRLSKQGEWATMTTLIDDDVLRTIAVYGTPEECGREIVERFGGLASRVSCYFPGYEFPPADLAALVETVRST
jgi:probable F420-dependent oxidoreductase